MACATKTPTKPVANRDAVSVRTKTQSREVAPTADHSIRRLQQSVGNQATLALLQSGLIQAKLRVGPPDDPYEREADRVADRVVRMPDPAVADHNQASGGIQSTGSQSPRGASGPTDSPAFSSFSSLNEFARTSLQRKCAECEEEEEKTLQRKNHEPASATVKSDPAVAPRIVHEVLNSPGQPLDAATRAFMEPRFAHDFSQVRVHTDARAAESARAVNALAYTVGRDVVVGSGQYAPGTRAGRSLMAHELTHVVQRRGNGESAAPLAIGSTDANEEREATSAETMMNTRGNHHGSSLPNGPGVLRRVPQEQTGGATSSGAAPSPAPAASCLKDGTGQNITLAPGTVTVIVFGAEWCTPCKELKATLEPICKSYQAKVPVSFYAVDVDLPSAPNTKPPVPAGVVVPTTFIFNGSAEAGQFVGKKTDKHIIVLLDKAVAAASSAKTPTPTPTPMPTPTPAPKPTPTPTAQACSFTLVGIDGNDTLEDTRKYTDAEIAKGRADNPTATSDSQIPTITSVCQRQTYQLITNQQNARILHVAWKKAPPPGTLSVPRAAIDDGGDQPAGKRPSVSTLNPQGTPLPSDCIFPKSLTAKPAWCVPFCSFGEFQMEVSVAYECDPTGSKQINTVQFGPKKITLKEKKP